MIISIVYEDSDILVINKPSGLITHPKNKDDAQKSVVSWLTKKYPQIKKVGDDKILRPGIVHRLDKYTSGLLIIAKNQTAFEYLKKQFQKRKIEKIYIALVHGKIAQSASRRTGVISSPLGKIGIKQTIKIKGKKDLKEKEAITEYKTTRVYDNFSLIEAHPVTGRTHQIRVHLNSIGHPIVGDTVYGSKKREIKLGRLFLHAFRLKFASPSGKALLFEAELPKELQSFLKKLSIAK